MAVDNLFLGFGRGKVGDVVFSRLNGRQVARARNRNPRNPRSPLQLLQRVVLKTSSQAFSAMQEICNHSFQGREGVTANQSRFQELNIARFRSQLADIINSGDPQAILQSDATNFSGKLASQPARNAYIISEGTILPPRASFVQNGGDASGALFILSQAVASGTQSSPVLSYADLIAQLGLLRGDQITIVWLSTDDSPRGVDTNGLFNGFAYGRFICEPSTGDMSANIFDDSVWNERNENIGFGVVGSDSLSLAFMPASSGMSLDTGTPISLSAAAYIISRNVGGTWQRSTSELVLRPYTGQPGSTSHTWDLTYDQDVWYLADAIYSFMQDQSSTLYLNQADF